MVSPQFAVTDHVFLEECWVCRTRFGPSVKEERHHLIPQAYGGKDGPQVSLCDSHHTALHNIALRMYSKRVYTDLLTGKAHIDDKLIYLAKVVYRARIATENDPNKKVAEMYSFDNETLAKLKRLKTIYRTSRESIVALAIRELYSKHFK